MEKVTVSRDDLVQIVRGNRDKHDVLYAAALEGFWKKADETLADQLAKVRTRETDRFYVSLSPPENHAKDYDYAIRMLELSIDTDITLSRAEFSQLVMNDWSWKTNFLTTATNYIGTGIAMCSGYAGF